ncbi:MAG TPA: serine/threonine-protein kinase [Myxococcaceae bacterium]
MEESTKRSSLQDLESPTLQRPPTGPASDEFASTLHPCGGEKGSAPQRTGSLPVAARERYLLHGVVAEGGHGRILRAEDLHLERMVALKELIEPGGTVEDRFVREARITARLQHPSIVPVYEAGRWPGGEPFYAMKLVSGRSLARHIEAMSTLGERLAALPHVLAVAEAMAYAHSQRVIHRDLKPSNILVGEFGETVVIDWGLAKELDRPEAPLPPEASRASPPQSPDRTQLGTVMGTPAYMPPEQAAGKLVDERADVYALGAILYHLLSGRPPYTGTASREVLEQVLQEEPTPLSQLQPTLPQELLTIVLRAMDREPARRYPTARELAEDLRHFQTGQLVGSHRYTTWQRMRRFARQYRSTLLVGGLALVVMMVVAGKSHYRVSVARDLAERERDLATDRADRLTLIEARGEVTQSPELVFKTLNSLSPGFSKWGAVRTLAADALAQGAVVPLRGHGERPVNCVSLSPDGRWLVSASDDRTVRLWDLLTGKSRVLETYGDEAWQSLFSPDGRYVASASKEGKIRLWEKTTGHSRTFEGHAHPVNGLSFSADGRLLLSTDFGGAMWQWDVASGTGKLLGRHPESIIELKPLPDERHAVSIARDNTVRLWNLEDGSSQLVLDSSVPLTSASLASRTGTLAVSTDEGQVLLWQSLPGKPRVLNGLPGSIRMVRLSQDGRYLAAQSVRGPIQLWDLKTGTSRTLHSAEGWGPSLAFTPDNLWLVAGGRDGKARLWEVATGRERLLHMATATVSWTSFSHDGQWLIASSDDGVIRLHEMAEHSARLLTQHEGPVPPNVSALESRRVTAGEIRQRVEQRVSTLTLTPDGEHALSVGRHDGLLHRSSLEDASAVTAPVPLGSVERVFAQPDGSRLLTVGQEGTVSVWDSQGRRLQRLAGPSHKLTVLTLSPDGAWAAAGDEQGGVWLWDVASGRVHELGRHQQRVRVLTFSPDGRHLASGGLEGELLLWDVASGAGRSMYRHEHDVDVVEFSPDGRYLASGSPDHTVWLQPLGAGEGRRLDMSGLGVVTLGFSPDGEQLFVSSLGDARLKRFAVATGEPLPSLTGHAHFVFHLAFSPEGRRLATASADGTVRLWDLSSGESRVLRGHEGAVIRVIFSRDGRQVLSAGQDGTVRMWLDDLPLEPQALRDWVSAKARE